MELKKEEQPIQFELPSVLPINFIATNIFVKCKQEEMKAEGAYGTELTVQAAGWSLRVYEMPCLGLF